MILRQPRKGFLRIYLNHVNIVKISVIEVDNTNVILFSGKSHTNLNFYVGISQFVSALLFKIYS